MILPVSPLFDEDVTARPLAKRAQLAASAISSESSRRKHLYHNSADHIYYNFYWTQAVIFFLRAGLNAAAFGLILKPVPDLVSNKYRAYERVYGVVTTGEEPHIGWWLLLGSLGLHFIGYASHRLYLVRSFFKDPNAVDGPAVLPHKVYTVAHLSLISKSGCNEQWMVTR